MRSVRARSTGVREKSRASCSIFEKAEVRSKVAPEMALETVIEKGAASPAIIKSVGAPDDSASGKALLIASASLVSATVMVGLTARSPRVLYQRGPKYATTVSPVRPAL